jgi:hypothetical protein
VRRELAAWAAGLGCVAAVALSVAATRHAPHADGSPIDPGGAWRTAWIAGSIGALVLAGCGVLLARRGRLRLELAIGVAVAVQALPLLAPLLLSRDVYLYWAEARVVTVHHANPYRVAPSRYADDPATRAASPQWRDQTEPYGPAWVAVGTVPSLAGGTSRDAVQLLYRILACAGVLAIVGLVAWRTRRAIGVALVGWNPLIALHFAGGGHSDALLALFLVVAVAFGRSAIGGAAWPVASMFKAIPVILLPLELARARLRLPRAFWLGLVGAGVGLALLATALFGTSWATTSVVGVHGSSPIGGVHFLTETGLRHRYAVVIAALVFAVVYGVLLREAWARGRSHLAFAAAALCMCSSLLRPWYALWPLALAAVEEDPLGELAAYSLTAYVLLADALPL